MKTQGIVSLLETRHVFLPIRTEPKSDGVERSNLSSRSRSEKRAPQQLIGCRWCASYRGDEYGPTSAGRLDSSTVLLRTSQYEKQCPKSTAGLGRPSGSSTRTSRAEPIPERRLFVRGARGVPKNCETTESLKGRGSTGEHQDNMGGTQKLNSFQPD